MDDISQNLAAVRDSMPRLWYALYQGSLAAGFDRTQAFNLVQTWILAQNPKGVKPSDADGPPPDDE